MWLGGFAVALAYSLEPVRLKRRDWLNPLSLMLVLYALPMSYGYVTLADEPDAAAIVVICAVGLQMLGLILLNPAEDVETDRASGIETPCVRHGLARVAAVAALVYGVGTAAAIGGFARLAVDRPVVVLAALGLAAAAQMYVFQEIVRLWLAARGRGASSAATVDRLVKRNPVHFAVLGAGLALASGLVLQ
jgi:4-hydroxybenzoate polyprenyltransferase